MPEPIRIRMDLTTARAVEFVDKLQNDNEFRTQLAANPREVLWEYGVEASPELIPETLTLPSPQQIALLNEKVQALLEDEETGVVAGPAMVFPLWTCVFSFPFLSGEQS
ncbi:MAG TPA: hypothetical protein VFV62_11810 [Gaiellaceae bacterium]|nr:hypothetical protein [Gaiellaceae bacterium]